MTQTPTNAWGFGLATLDSAGTVLDVWFPSPALGEPPADATEPQELTALAGKDDAARRRSRGGQGGGRRPVGRAGQHPGRVAAAAPDLEPSVRAAQHLDGRRLRPAHQRGVDQPRPVRGRRVRVHPGTPAGGRSPRHGVRRRQVPPPGRLRAADRRAHRRRRPRAARRPPRRGHHRDARGLRELQRRHARRVDGRGADLGRRPGRGRHRRRRWRLDHGHPLRRRHHGHLDRRALPARAPTPASASRWATTASSRPVATSPPAPR